MFTRHAHRTLQRAAPLLASPSSSLELRLSSHHPSIIILQRLPSLQSRHASQQQFPRGNRFSPPPPPPPSASRQPWGARFPPPNQQEPARPLISEEQLSRTLSSPQLKWTAVGSVAAALLFYLYNLEEVPVSGRKRFNCFSEESMEKAGLMEYNHIMAQTEGARLPAGDPRSRQVERVIRRLLPFSGLGEEGWEVVVINEPNVPNAFVLPGRKVFVFTGILPICRNEDGLATVLGHEIAHNVASHAAERRSLTLPVDILFWTVRLIDVTGIVGALFARFALDLMFQRPASRLQESEADYIGLLMMARACYDPGEAVRFWQRMEQTTKEAGQEMEWMSTHPSHGNREGKITQWLPKAEEMRESSDCAATTAYSDGFNRMFGRRHTGLW